MRPHSGAMCQRVVGVLLSEYAPKGTIVNCSFFYLATTTTSTLDAPHTYFLFLGLVRTRKLLLLDLRSSARRQLRERVFTYKALEPNVKWKPPGTVSHLPV